MEPTAERDSHWQLAEALTRVGRDVRDVVRGRPLDQTDAAVVRHEGGDDVFGVDGHADRALLEGLARLDPGWSGTVVCEGFDEPQPVAGGDGPWRYLADPIDGTRGFLAGKRSAWVLLGAGRGARHLEDLDVGVAVEIPGPRAARGVVASAVRGGGVRAVEDDLSSVGGAPVTTVFQPRSGGGLSRTFVTVVRLLPGGHGPIGAFADKVLEGLEVYDDRAPCTGGQLMGVAGGNEAAVIDPRPVFDHPLCAHPYDLAAFLIAREAGAIVESLDGRPLDIPLDTESKVAWAAYANAEIAAQLRPRIRAALAMG